MCGRYTLTATSDALVKHFQLKNKIVMEPRYNIAPTQIVPVIKTFGQIDFLQWGFIPTWMADRKTAGFINARAETLNQKPSFRTAIKKRRCLVIANGYYEWKELQKIKQPYYIHRPDEAPFAFAGIWEDETFAILTTQANQKLLELHQRMPIILSPSFYQTWLNPALPIDIQSLLDSNDADNFEFFPVTTKINNPKFEDPECIKSLLI